MEKSIGETRSALAVATADLFVLVEQMSDCVEAVEVSTDPTTHPTVPAEDVQSPRTCVS